MRRGFWSLNSSPHRCRERRQVGSPTILDEDCPTIRSRHVAVGAAWSVSKRNGSPSGVAGAGTL